MAQAQPEKEPEMEIKNKITTSASFKFNAQAPEFVPRSQTQMPISGYFYPYFNFLGESGGSDWFYVGDDYEEQIHLIPNSNAAIPNYSKNFLTEDLQQKIINQVEYQFSDMNLLANESLVKLIKKDPEGYVPISFIASTKKIKSLITNNQLLSQALRCSSKLVVSNDGKKVRRKHLFSDTDREELQSRTVIAEYLPEDHSHQNLEKIFSVVGRVKTIRICHPQESNPSRSKGDFVVSNKLHALVEYETTKIAEKAVEKLNDERNWRQGLRVRLLLRRSPKSVLTGRKSEFDGIFDDDEDSSQPFNSELVLESAVEENAVGSKKGWGRGGRGKSRPRTPSHNAHGLLAPCPQPTTSIHSEASAKQITKGPRMPDGTRGFTMGRGKPICPAVLATPTLE